MRNEAIEQLQILSSMNVLLGETSFLLFLPFFYFKQTCSKPKYEASENTSKIKLLRRACETTARYVSKQ